MIKYTLFNLPLPTQIACKRRHISRAAKRFLTEATTGNTSAFAGYQTSQTAVYIFPGGTQPIFGYRCTVEGLKPRLCLGQKNSKIHTLFTTTTLYDPVYDKGQNAYRTYLLEIAIEQVLITLITFVAWKYKKKIINQIK